MAQNPAQLRAVALLPANALALTTACAVPAAAATRAALVSDPAALVNPFIGTTNSADDFPGAGDPYGMVQWSPDSSGNVSTYVFATNSMNLSAGKTVASVTLPSNFASGALHVADQSGVGQVPGRSRFGDRGRNAAADLHRNSTGAQNWTLPRADPPAPSPMPGERT